MKVTFVLPPVNMSGGIRVVAIQARQLMARGHEVLLVSPAPRDRRLPWRQRLRQLFESPPQRRSHVEGAGLNHVELDVFRPVTDADLPDADVVVATWWETAEWVHALSPSKGAKAYLVQGHEVWSESFRERSSATYRLPLHKIVVSAWLARVMAREYGEHEVDVVPNGVDHAQFFAPPRRKQARPTVGFLFSNAPLKGVDVTLEAIQRLRLRHPGLRVIAFGSEPPLKGRLPNVELAIDPPQSMLREFYASVDVWLTASRSEGFNLTAMEAMACRTPVVATRTGWPEDAIEDCINGRLVDVDDVAGLSEAADWVLSQDERAWRNLSEAAWRTVRDESWERSAQLLESALRRVAARATGQTVAAL